MLSHPFCRVQALSSRLRAEPPVFAHASCFSMALSAQLGERGITPDAIETTCTVTFESLTLTQSALQTTVTARGVDRA